MLDAMLDGNRMRMLQQHVAMCESCSSEFASLHANKQLMASLAPHPVPPELALRLRVAISRETVSRRRSRWDGMLVRWENTINAFMFPAAAGLLSAVLIFGLLIGVLVPTHFSGANDVPTILYTPPEMTLAPFGSESWNSNGDAILVEAYVDAHGRVQDYRVLNAPGQVVMTPEMKNALIFTQFRPATSFGRPVSGRVVISFSNINVGG
jgi:hypothetical protein